MTNDECWKRVAAMIAGEAELSLRLLRIRAMSMRSTSNTPVATAATEQMIEAAELLDAAATDGLPRSVMETLWEAAKASLPDIVETSTFGASPRRD